MAHYHLENPAHPEHTGFFERRACSSAARPAYPIDQPTIGPDDPPGTDADRFLKRLLALTKG